MVELIVDRFFSVDWPLNLAMRNLVMTDYDDNGD